MLRTSLFGYAACTIVWLACSIPCKGGEPVVFRPGRVIPLLGENQRNLVPNASFECGADGWGSAELDHLPGWYGPLNGLFGQLDATTAADGSTSLKVELTPENQPVAHNDYLHVVRRPIYAPLAANVGWLAVKPGTRYRYSVAMKAAEAGTPARLVVRQFHAAPTEKLVHLTTDWQRYEIEFTATAEACYVLAGPDLRKGDDHGNPPPRATVWLDAVQLAPADAKAGFVTRLPIEFGITTDRAGNIFTTEETITFHVKLARADAQDRRAAKIELRLTDFFDREVWRDEDSYGRPAQSSIEAVMVGIKPSSELRGFLRLHAKLTCGDTVTERSMRLAVIPDYKLKDSRFGLNHAFGWPEMLDLCRRAGLIWMRDWSPKWQDVEPEKGRFDFTETDTQIDRILSKGLKVLCVLAFPSNMWASSAPDDVQPPDPWYNSPYKSPDPERQRDEILAEVDAPYRRMGYAPRDLAEFENYVAATVAHYKGRIHDWQIFNEPIHTNYALDGQAGYQTADFVQYIEPFVRAARRSDSDCRIIGGYNIEGYHPSQGLPYTLPELERFIGLGGLKHLDVFAIHIYPSLEPPEGMEQVLERLNAVMDQHGTQRPIWLTEHAYYADDEPWISPIIVHPNGAHLPSEQVQAAYQVRFNVTLLANGVEKILSHAGIGSAVNHTNLWTMFLRYDSQPFKCFASQAVMAQLFTPSCKFVKKLMPDESIKAYLFRDEGRTVGVFWATTGAKANPIRLDDECLQLWDMMGRPQASRTFTPSETPVYVVAKGISPEEFERFLAVVP